MELSIAQRLAVSEERFRAVLITFMALGFFSLIVAGIAAGWVTRQNEIHTEWVSHTYRVELAIADLGRTVEQSETARRGHLLAPRPTATLRAFNASTRALPGAVERLGILIRDNPSQRANLARLRGLVADQVARSRASIAAVDAGRRAEAISMFGTEVAARQMRLIRGKLARMAGEERQLLARRDADQQRSVRAFYVVLSVAAVLLLLVAVTSMLVVLRFTRDLTASRNSLRLLNDTLEEQVTDRTADLSRANEEIQRFAYIVSHDLRSPLVNVMGFTAELESATQPITELVDRAEADAPHLLTQGAREAARIDLPEAIGFIRTSTQKMDRLINAILKLSREGRRVITPERVDMDALVGGIRDSIAHQLDEEGTELIVASPLPTVVSDRLAIEQILSNLIENAAKYLLLGRPGRITVSGAANAGRISYAVADNGRGIAPADHSRVFDLFRRSGSQDKPGEGIGLAHVRALAYRLGGTVDMTSELGQGTTFRLTLPATYGT